MQTVGTSKKDSKNQPTMAYADFGERKQGNLQTQCNGNSQVVTDIPQMHGNLSSVKLQAVWCNTLRRVLQQEQ